RIWSAGGQEREGQGMFLWTRRYLSSAVVVLVVLASAAAAGAAAQNPRGLAGAQRAVAKPGGDPVDAVAHDVSPPLVDMVADSSSDTKEKKEKKQHGVPVPVGSPLADPVVQATEGAAAAPALGQGFECLGAGFPGVTVDSTPPDTNGAVGPHYYVQLVNDAFDTFDEQRNRLYGPA